MRVLGAAMVLLFGFAAAVQWNDPDPLRWIVFYGIAGVVAAGVAAGRSWRRLEWAACALFVAVSLWLAPAIFDARSEAFTSIKMKSPGDELVRELVGALLCLVWCVAVLVWRRGAGATRLADPASDASE